MSLTIDDLPLNPAAHGLSTIGDVLTHVSNGRRLVVQLLVDGEEPDYRDMATLRAQPLAGRTLFLETALPRQVAEEVLSGVGELLEQADECRIAAAEAYRLGDGAKGMRELSGGFGRWQQAQECVSRVAELTGVDPRSVKTEDGLTLEEVAANFASALRQLKEAIETQDYVLCTDVLTYDMESTTRQWTQAAAALVEVFEK